MNKWIWSSPENEWFSIFLKKFWKRSLKAPNNRTSLFMIFLAQNWMIFWFLSNFCNFQILMKIDSDFQKTMSVMILRLQNMLFWLRTVNPDFWRVWNPPIRVEWSKTIRLHPKFGELIWIQANIYFKLIWYSSRE